jgi:hypothetical protein
VSEKVIRLTGETGGGRREFVVFVDDEEVGDFNYEDCGWGFRGHAVVFKNLAAALDVPFVDETDLK